MKDSYLSDKQLAYAKLLDISVKSASLILVLFFVIYIFEATSPDIPLSELPHYWHLPLEEYLQQTNYNAGWSWLGLLSKSDFLNYIPLVLLAGISILCYIRIIPILAAKKDKWYIVIAIAEIAILILAASGVLT